MASFFLSNAQVKISALPAATDTPALSSLTAIVESGVTKKATLQKIKNAILNNVTAESIGGWALTGNTGTTAANYLGTGDSADVLLKTKALERLRINALGDVAINNSTPEAKFQVKGLNASRYSFLVGDSADGGGGKTFIYNDATFNAPAFRSGLLGNLVIYGLGNGTGYWDRDSIGTGSVVLGAINSKATALNAQVYGGAINSASAQYSVIIGGINNNASVGDGASIISSSFSNVSGNTSLVTNGSYDTITGTVSTIIGSTRSRISAGNSAILNSTNAHIDFTSSGSSNLIASSTLCGIGGNTRLAFCVGGYKNQINGTHGTMLGGAYDTSYSYHEVTFGNSAFNDNTGTPSSMVYSDLMMNVGNAFDSSEHQSCFVMIKNGNIAIGDSLGIGDKPTIGGPMLRVKGNVLVDSLLSLGSGLDSVTLYAITPAKPTIAYCNNCSGSGVTGRFVAYIASAWRRLKFD